MSGRFPKSGTTADLWRHLIDGDDLVEEVSRWDLPGRDGEGSGASPGPGSRCTHGGLLEDIDRFDPRFFNISRREAAYMDPAQRLFLEESWRALEDAGRAGAGIGGSRCGVYAGIGESGYWKLFGKRPPAQAMWGAASSVIPARIAYYLDLQGPAVALDTACSSSLVAVHLACQGLWTGEIDLAIAGGVSVLCVPDIYLAGGQAGMLSPTGRCFTFDRRADGFIPGEGVGAVVLKRLAEATADRDRVLGVIAGSGINQDGASNGLTAPSARSQERLERRVYETFHIDPGRIGMVEAHGTGTILGDPIEFEALTRAFRRYTDKKRYCAVGSIKTNIGHALAAAGIAGLIKILLSLAHRRIPPTLHYRSGNPNIDFEESPLYVNTRPREWEAEPGAPRAAALSSFGFSGTNAHLVIEEAPASPGPPPGRPGWVIVLSAPTPGGLRRRVEQLVDLRGREPETSLGNMSYTLLMGRKHFHHRLACVARDVEELSALLEKWLKTGSVPRIYTSALPPNARREQPSLKRYGNRCIQESRTAENAGDCLEHLFTIADLYIQGYDLAFEHLFTGDRCARISLPVYSFERVRCWPPEAETGGAASATPPRLSPAPAPEEGVEIMTFEEVWQERPLPEGTPPAMNTVVCFLSEPENQRAAVETMRTLDAGAEVVFIAAGEGYHKESERKYTISRADGNTYRRAFEGIREDRGAVDAVLYQWPLEDPGLIGDCSPIVRLLRAMASAAVKPGRLLLAGRFDNGPDRSRLESWIGFERSLGLVMPDTKTAVILGEAGEDDPGSTMGEWTGRPWAELAAPRVESAFYRNGKRHVQRIRPTEATPGEAPLKTGGTCLITGGLGGLGLLFAEHLAKTRRMDLILTGRSPLDDEKRSRVERLEALGVRVVYVQADVCDGAGMKEGLRPARERLGEIRGVIHAAGIRGGKTIFEKDAREFQRVTAPKIEGTLVLDDLLREEPLDFTCYFSSSAAILGDFGACDYAVGNRFQLAHARRRDRRRDPGRPRGRVLAIAWPAWREGGMGFGDDGNAGMYLKSSGQRFLETGEGLAIFDRLLAGERSHHLVLKGEPGRVHRFLGLGGGRPPEKRPAVSSIPGETSGAGTRGGRLERRLARDLKALAGGLLETPPGELDAEADFSEFGFDSVSLAEFAAVLTRHYGFDVAPALFFGYFTLEKLARYFATEHREEVRAFYGEGAPAIPQRVDNAPRHAPPAPRHTPRAPRHTPPAPRHTPRAPRHTPEPILEPILEPVAIIGMSGRFPGADDVEAFWRNIATGKRCITEIPGDRWDWRTYYGDPGESPGRTPRGTQRGASGGTLSKWGGFMADVDKFDPLFFGISPGEAELMDPGQRLFLEESWRALEDAGCMGGRIRGGSCGVYAGVEESDYGRLAGPGRMVIEQNAMLPARIAYILDLKGPNLAVNAACASGLAAVHQACNALRAGDCDMALAGGVSVMATPATHLALSRVDMLSPDGECHVFDKRANGMTPGEAAAVVALKPLSRALSDGDRIHGCIKGSGVNYDGRTNGITAPNPLSQEALLTRVYDGCGVDPGDIQFVLAHGAGTKLGDSVEMRALTRAFGRRTDRKGYCGIGSVKPLIGHTFAASGVVGLIGVVMAMKHRTLPGMPGWESPNETIDPGESPFVIHEEARAWKTEEGRPRLCTVGATGINGANAHAVIEEAPANGDGERIPVDRDHPALFVLSAKSEERLSVVAGNLLAWLRDRQGKPEPLINRTIERKTVDSERGMMVDEEPGLGNGASKGIDRLTNNRLTIDDWKTAGSEKGIVVDEEPGFGSGASKGIKRLTNNRLTIDDWKTAGSEKRMMVDEKPGFESESSKGEQSNDEQSNDEQSEPLINRTIERKTVGSEKGMMVDEEPGFESESSKGKSEQSDEQSEPLSNRTIERKTLNPELLNPEPLNPEPLNPEPLNPEPLSPSISKRDWEENGEPAFANATARQSLLHKDWRSEATSINSQFSILNSQLSDIAYTLQVGREAMDHRLAFAADSEEALLKALEGCCNGDSSGSILRGRAETGRDATMIFHEDDDVDALVRVWMEKRKLDRVANAWVNGLTIDWAPLYHGVEPRFTTLPTYPFERERYWIPATGEAGGGAPPSRGGDAREPTFFIDPAHSIEENVRGWLTWFLRGRLKLPEDRIAMNRDIRDYGVDSILGRRLARDFEKRFHVEMTGMDMLENPTIASLSARLAEKLDRLPPGDGAATPAGAGAAAPPDDPEGEALDLFLEGALTLEETMSLV